MNTNTHTGSILDCCVSFQSVKSNDQWWPDLYLKKGRVLQKVTPEQCAVIREIYNDGRGYSEISKDIMIYDERGRKIGRVSYNGSVWLTDADGDKEVPQDGRKTAAQHDIEGWRDFHLA